MEIINKYFILFLFLSCNNNLKIENKEKNSNVFLTLENSIFMSINKDSSGVYLGEFSTYKFNDYLLSFDNYKYNSKFYFDGLKFYVEIYNNTNSISKWELFDFELDLDSSKIINESDPVFGERQRSLKLILVEDNKNDKYFYFENSYLNEYIGKDKQVSYIIVSNKKGVIGEIQGAMNEDSSIYNYWYLNGNVDKRKFKNQIKTWYKVRPI